MSKNIKCKHYNGDGYTYQIFDGELSLCEECERCLREGMLEQIEIENKLILPIVENKNGQRRITIPKGKLKTKYVEVKKHE